jgi:hypothetical protein
MSKSFFREILLILLAGILFYPFVFMAQFLSVLLFGEGASLTDAKAGYVIVIVLILLSIIFIRLYWPSKNIKNWWVMIIRLLMIWTQYILFFARIKSI